MDMAFPVDVVLGSIAFAVFWVLAVFPTVPFMPIRRTAGSLLGGLLMVLFGVMTPDQAYSTIDLPILGLLFGTMVVSVYLERADMCKYLAKLLAWTSKGAKDLIFRICLISAISSALFTNDTSCVILTEFVLTIARQHNLPPHPFLLALATSANIGSAATPIGSPQNLVIAFNSKISFGDFLIGIRPAMLVGLIVNFLLLLCMYWSLLSIPIDEEDAIGKVVADENRIFPCDSPATMLHSSSLNSQEWNSILETMNPQISPKTNTNTAYVDTLKNRESFVESEMIQMVSKSAVESNAVMITVTSVGSSERRKENLATRWKRTMWKPCVYLVTLGMLISFLMDFNMSWTAITAAIALIVLDFNDAHPCLEKVSYPLLVFFCGMFATVAGFNKTGIPSTLWDLVEPYAKINDIFGIAVLAIVILVLSNLASNVPTVLLLRKPVALSASAISATHEKKAWLILAWVSTVAGNLSLLGSAANLMVCEQARHALVGYNLSFWKHLKFGVPSTLIVTAIGLALLKNKI
ncbi:PREDICTED: putative transporter arsB isoform X3 [Theobroma cacao]|uniref:Transporter arsB isoform X3 n=1 Tax=Theobroma cacao TaxID=3641 RepID=A0AB32W345_THECC|nr:PREDICTED: putative transporter arsB isoform X3 [Theobroma cacao]